MPDSPHASHHPKALPRATMLAHSWVAAHLASGGVAIDATAGNGHDTLFLAQHCGPTGAVHAFDIQAEAIHRTQTRLNAADIRNVTVHQCCHSQMADRVDNTLSGQVDAITFNLGYLPGGDKSCITRRDSTLLAIERGLSLLAPGGIMTIVIYTGHADGIDEADAVEAYVTQLPPTEWHAAHYRPLSQSNRPPELIGVARWMP